MSPDPAPVLAQVRARALALPAAAEQAVLIEAGGR